jgi:hypothetical protein
VKDDSPRAKRAHQVWLTPEACDLAEFKALISRTTSAADCPLAAETASNVPVYEGAAIRAASASARERREMMAKALAERWTAEAFGKAVEAHAARRLT